MSDKYDVETDLIMKVPEPDYIGFAEYVKHTYCDNRWERVHIDEDLKSGGFVTVISGEYPSFSRFVKDIRPVLHEYGFVIANIKKDHPTRSVTSDEMVNRHLITGIPMMWVVAYVNGMVCNRGACRNIRLPNGPYCAECDDIWKWNTGEVDADKVRMVNP